MNPLCIQVFPFDFYVKSLCTHNAKGKWLSRGNEGIEEFFKQYRYTPRILVPYLHTKRLTPTVHLQSDLLLLSNSSGVSGPYSSSSPACLDEVRLCLEAEKKELQKGQKSSSLTNINQKAKTAANRRRSLPGTPTHGRNGWVWTALLYFGNLCLFTLLLRVR